MEEVESPQNTLEEGRIVGQINDSLQCRAPYILDLIAQYVQTDRLAELEEVFGIHNVSFGTRFSEINGFTRWTLFQLTHTSIFIREINNEVVCVSIYLLDGSEDLTSALQETELLISLSTLPRQRILRNLLLAYFRYKFWKMEHWPTSPLRSIFKE